MPNYSQRGIAHILLLILLLGGMALGVYLVQNQTNLFSRAFNQSKSIDQLTEELLTENNQVSTGRSAQESKIGKMLALASIRKEKLLEELGQDTQAFLEDASLTEERDSFPEPVKELIETKKELSGYLNVVHLDLADQKSAFSYSLIDESDQTYELFFSDNPPGLLTGSKIQVQGVELGSRIALESAKKDPGSLQVIQAATGGTFGEQELLVILVNFKDLPSRPVSKEEIDRLLFDQGIRNSLDSFYRENSFGNLTVRGIVTDWVTLDTTTDRECYRLIGPGRSQLTGIWDWTQQADAAVSKLGFKTTDFKRLAYIFPDIRSCQGLYGAGSIGGTYDEDIPNRPTFNPSRIWVLSDRLSPRIYHHEFGHNIGMGHANDLICGALEIDSYDKCTSWEYGDITDIMGNHHKVQASFQFNGPHKALTGWLADSLVEVPLKNAYFSLSVLETPGDDLKVVMVPKVDTAEHYYFSYRQPVGSDETMSGEFTRGVSIHIAPDVVPTNNFPARTQMITVLVDHQWFYDPLNKIAIRQINHDSKQVTFQLKVNQLVDPSTVIPTPVPVPSLAPGDNWAINAQLVCANKANPIRREKYRVVTAVWPDVPYDLNNPIKYIRSTFSYEDPDYQQISIKNNLPVSSAYVGLETESGKFLTPIGTPQDSDMEYGKFFNSEMVRWDRGELPAGLYEIKFQAPDSWCK